MRAAETEKASRSAAFDVSDLEKRVPPVLNYNAPPPAAAPAQAAAAMDDAAPVDKVEVQGTLNRSRESSAAYSPAPIASRKVQGLPAAPPAGPLAERQWLDRIEKLLAQGRHAEAVADWKAFREVYPNYPVPQATREKLE